MLNECAGSVEQLLAACDDNWYQFTRKREKELAEYKLCQKKQITSRIDKE